MQKAAPKAKGMPGSPVTAAKPGQKGRTQHWASKAGGQQKYIMLDDWKQQEVIREWRQMDFGSGASAIMTMVEAMLEEGVLWRPSGEAGNEFDRRVEAFQMRRAAAAEVAAAGVRTGGLTEFGSGATAVITMGEAMLEEGVLVRPEGKAGREFERRVKAFKKRKAGRMYAQEE
jgi:hypothetical protein